MSKSFSDPRVSPWYWPAAESYRHAFKVSPFWPDGLTAAAKERKDQASRLLAEAGQEGGGVPVA